MITRKHALLAAAFVAAGSRRALAQTPALTPLRIASTPNDDVTSALYALQQDMFRKAGLDVALSTLSSGSAITAAVAGGAIDIGRSSMLPLITARSRGVGFMLVAPSGLYLASAAVRTFAQVMQTASAYCNTHQAQTVDLLASFTKMDPATIAGMSRTTFAPSLERPLIQPLIDTAAKYKFIDQAFDAREFIAHV